MQTLDPDKLGSCMGSPALGAPNIPVQDRKCSQTPHAHPSGAWALLVQILLSGSVPWAWESHMYPVFIFTLYGSL